MNILFHIVHPAQFHLFRNVIAELEGLGHQCFVAIKSKDILEELLMRSGLTYYNILEREHRKTRFGMIRDMVVRNVRILRFVRKNKIDLLVGSSVEAAQVGWLLRKPRITVVEDDASVIPLFHRVAGPFIETLLTPLSCDNGRLEKKSVKYAGYHKLAYLHPNRFTPDRTVVEKYFPSGNPYFILRFAKLKAYHDVSARAQGITADIARHLIGILKEKGNVYISSERELEPEFEPFRLTIDPADMHHLLAFATLYIGDSQSMAVEAAMLGIPSIRFNSFAGKIGVLEELEHMYGLTFGISPDKPDQLYAKVRELLSTQDLRVVFQLRRQKLLSEKIDVTAFLAWFIGNYPESRRTMEDDPDYQFKFLPS